MKTNDRISLDEAKRLLYLFERGIFEKNERAWVEIPDILGLVSTHDEKSWLNSTVGVSFLKIVDEKRWFLSKIKYGI